MRYFKGQTKILASMLSYKNHYKNFIFLLQNLFRKGRASISDAPQYSFFCLVIWHQYHFDTITHFCTVSYPSIQRHPFVFKTNGCLNFQKHLSIRVLGKKASWNIFGIKIPVPVKHPCWSPF